MAREKRTLSTLLSLLDAKSKTILEAWHTQVEGVAYGQTEQNQSGTYSSSQPFIRFGRRGETQDPESGTVNPLENSWPTVSSVRFGDPFTSGSKPRNIIELWYNSTNTVLSGPETNQVQRADVKGNLSNFFSSSTLAAKDYSQRFYGALNGKFANVPEPQDVEFQGAAGFNVGQVKPFNDNNEYVFGDRREVDFAANNVIQGLLATAAAYEQELMEIRPGANRISIHLNIRTNLNKLLQQNLLLPSDIDGGGNVNLSQDLATAIEDGNVSNISNDTFDQLYLNNRSSLHSSNSGRHSRNPAGTIGGRPVSDLIGPRYTATQGGPQPEDGTEVFSFEEDKQRANTFTKERGFIDNTPGNVFLAAGGVGGLLPSVDNDDDTSGTRDRTTYLKSLARQDTQLFPFMFETVNKEGSARNGQEFKQYAYFQATLQSLNESYAPAWSSKHFFGRTEQIHTYTMTERNIDLSFVIFAHEIRKLQNLYERVTWLAQQTYPSYDASQRLKAGPLIRMGVGDMFSNLTGFIRSLSFDWSYLGPGGKWEITKGLRIPMACSVQMNFTVIHDNMPDRNYALYPGPLLHPKGLISDRGNAEGSEATPLIPTADRPTDGNFENYTNTRNEQYIDVLNRNKSVGTVVTNNSGDLDLIF